MKILFKSARFSGGSARSLLEYAKLFDARGDEVVFAARHMGALAALFEKNGIKTVDTAAFSNVSPFVNIPAMRGILKVIKAEKPDLLASVLGNETVYARLAARRFALPHIGIIAGGEIFPATARLMRGIRLIVFSEENKRALMDGGCAEKDITVVKNRFDMAARDQTDGLYKAPQEEIRLLSPSRLVKGKTGSVSAVMALAQRLFERGLKVRLSVAGDGACFDRIRKRADEINAACKEEIITMAGDVLDMSPLYARSHIVFGKGRGVIEAVGRGHMAVVVGEDGRMCAVKPGVYDNLAFYNLSGRNIEKETSFSEIENLVRTLIEGALDFSDFDAVREIFVREYDVTRAGGVIKAAFDRAKEQPPRKGFWQKSAAALGLGYVKTSVFAYFYARIK